jgi:hypothetical protein
MYALTHQMKIFHCPIRAVTFLPPFLPTRHCLMHGAIEKEQGAGILFSAAPKPVHILWDI